MPTMNAGLPTKCDAFVEGEVVRDSLQRLRREIGRGLDQAHAGEISSRSIADIAAAAARQADGTPP